MQIAKFIFGKLGCCVFHRDRLIFINNLFKVNYKLQVIKHDVFDKSRKKLG